MVMSTFLVFCLCPGVLLGLGTIGFLIWQHFKKGVFDLNANLKLAAIISLILGAVPLLMYPFLVMANIMSFAAPHTNEEPFGLTLVVNIFLFSSTAYPIVYILCAVFAIVHIRKDKGKPAFSYGIAPIIYLVLLVGLLATWAALSSNSV
jgi:hypothetical protein